ncbi:MAG: GNAT family N-acetyltransferase [Anaerolineae bacterium]|nr:GNAT family N-acetyltransferase [Anaerolineae bacterium]
MMTTSDLCDFLPWDTEFFGQRIGRVVGMNLNPGRVVAILRWCEDNGIACLYFLADSADAQTVRLAEKHSFQLVDVRVTFEQRLSQRSGNALSVDADGITVRAALPADVQLLQALAKDSYRDSRYYFDPCFSRERCDELYQTWIRRSCEGYADSVWVAELDGGPVGYVTCHLSKDCAEGQIGLIGVGREVSGQGIGTRLMQTALAWFADKGVSTAVVVTQGRNIAAQRLYQRCGFVTRELQLWYHKWFIECEQERTG